MTAGREFRANYDATYEPDGPGDVALLERVCALLDQTEEMERILAAEGYTVAGGNGQPAPHPLLGQIRSHSAEIARLIRSLNLEPEPARTSHARKAAVARWTRP